MLVHALKVYNPLDNSVDEVFISNYAYEVICQGDDQEVARLWAALKEAESSGYTDEGFLSHLRVESERLGYQLFKADLGDITLVSVRTAPVIANRLIVWRVEKPIVKKKLRLISEKSKMVPWLDVSQLCWVDDAAILAQTMIGRDAVGYDESRRLVSYARSVLKLTNPFTQIIQASTLPGYELMRRLLL